MLVYYAPWPVALRNRIQPLILLLASLVFYAFHHPVLLALLLGSIAINIWTAYGVQQSYGWPGSTDIPEQAGLERGKGRARLFAFLGVALNLSVLGFFKYSPLFARSFVPAEWELHEFLIALPLPVGISFFTFQGISLMVDVFRGDAEPRYRTLVVRDPGQHSLRTAFFIAFFPQLVAGPIVRAHDFLPQIGMKLWREIPFEYCLRRLILGYFLKLFVADNLKDYTFWISFPHFLEHSSITLLVLLFAYSMQIFADFAGYSLIAIGVARLFGYRLPENFRFPYIAASFSEFWQRWHISLSTFLKHYLYIPLGGNRHGRWRTYLNLMITMGLGGLWHGAAWGYAVWGLTHGMALAVERLARDFLPEKLQLSADFWITRWLRIAIVLTTVSFAWLLFKLTDYEHAYSFVVALLSNAGREWDIYLVYFPLVYSLPVLLYHAWYVLRQRWPELGQRFEGWVFAVLLFLIITNSGSADEFIYFQF